MSVGRALMLYQPLVNYPKPEKMYLPSPTERCFILCYSTRKNKDLLTCNQSTMRDYYSSANEKPLHFKHPVSSNGLFVNNNPYEISLSSTKEHSSPLLSGLARGSLDSMFQIAIRCCSGINSFC